LHDSSKEGFTAENAESAEKCQEENEAFWPMFGHAVFSLRSLRPLR
jgi:hypothetical protein